MARGGLLWVNLTQYRKQEKHASTDCDFIYLQEAGEGIATTNGAKEGEACDVIRIAVHTAKLLNDRMPKLTLAGEQLNFEAGNSQVRAGSCCRVSSQ